MRAKCVTIAVLAFVLVAGTATAQSRYYDSQGRSTGRSERSGTTTRYYDGQGRSTGRAVRSGNTVRLYDSQGRSRGRIERSARRR